MTRRWTLPLLGLAALFGLFAVFVALTGGIETRLAGMSFRSRTWQRPAAVAVILAVAGASSGWRQFVPFLSRAARFLPLLSACWAGAAALVFGTFVVGGADSYGYVSQAELLARGRLTMDIAGHPEFTWPDLQATLTPLGYRAGATAGLLAPIYPPGLPLLMAPFTRIHAHAVFFLVPLCAALAVWLCARLGREMNEPLAGALTAMLLAASPTFLMQAVQPMSDVPVATAWIAALLLARRESGWSAPAAGAMASLAILIRPNLAALGVLVVIATTTAGGARSLRRAAACGAAMAPGIVTLAAIQYVRYGSPLASGYGTFGQLFSIGNVGPNLMRYPRWLIETHTPFIFVWLLAPLWIVRAPGPSRRFAWACYGFCLVVFFVYLPYVYFGPDEWTYARFMLPALPLMLLFGVILLLCVCRRVIPRAANPAVVLLAVALAGWCAVTARSLGSFRLRAIEQKYSDLGGFVRARLPESAYVLAMQHSGSIRYYAGRQTIRWDLLDRASLDRAVSELRGAGHEPFVVVDAEEDAVFRRRFGFTDQRALDSMVLLATIGRTRVYAFR